MPFANGRTIKRLQCRLVGSKQQTEGTVDADAEPFERDRQAVPPLPLAILPDDLFSVSSEDELS